MVLGPHVGGRVVTVVRRPKQHAVACRHRIAAESDGGRGGTGGPASLATHRADDQVRGQVGDRRAGRQGHAVGAQDRFARRVQQPPARAVALQLGDPAAKDLPGPGGGHDGRRDDEGRTHGQGAVLVQSHGSRLEQVLARHGREAGRVALGLGQLPHAPRGHRVG
ncbi:hypothetical protein, partial [Caulobacter sp. SSI4214]|uniref:hypothetical protein n=1 Tax=Caulobacter sp. SSI4214 TaxID=2575739 RepID=UPI00316AC4B4